MFWEQVVDNDEKIKFIVASWNDKHLRSTLKIENNDLKKSNFCENLSNTLSEVKNQILILFVGK